MGNETEKDFQQKPNTTGTVDQSRKNPSHQGGQIPSQQDPSKKNPSHGDDPRDDDEDSGQLNRRRAS
jgi:hypothetical protein